MNQNDVIDDVKSKICKSEEIPLKDIKLIFDRKEIENGKTLHEIGMNDRKNIIYLELKS